MHVTNLENFRRKASDKEVCVCVCIYIYIYIYMRERERERERELIMNNQASFIFICFF